MRTSCLAGFEGRLPTDFMEEMTTVFKRQGRMRTSETCAAAPQQFRPVPETGGTSGGGDRLDTMTAYEAHSGESLLQYVVVLHAKPAGGLQTGPGARNRLPEVPFSGTYTGVDKTVKRAMPPGCASAVEKCGPAIRLTTPEICSLLSFYTRGMPAWTWHAGKKDDLSSGTLT